MAHLNSPPFLKSTFLKVNLVMGVKSHHIHSLRDVQGIYTGRQRSWLLPQTVPVAWMPVNVALASVVWAEECQQPSLVRLCVASDQELLQWNGKGFPLVLLRGAWAGVVCKRWQKWWSQSLSVFLSVLGRRWGMVTLAESRSGRVGPQVFLHSWDSVFSCSMGMKMQRFSSPQMKISIS